MAARRAAGALAALCSAQGAALGAARPQGAAAGSLASAAAAALQQARGRSSGIAVDVPNGNVDKAWRTLNRKLKEERYMEAAREKEFFVKPSQKRKQEASAAAKRFRKQEFRDILGWIMRRRAGGF